MTEESKKPTKNKIDKGTNTMSTKERIAYEALVLFSQKGYKGTSVKDIAEAIGIKDSSLYKHYKSKQEILDTIMLAISKRIDDMSEELGVPSWQDYDKSAAFYGAFDQEGLAQFSKKIFLFYLKDDLFSKFWRVGCMEQFHNSEVYSLFRKFFYDDSILYQTMLFGQMIRYGVFIETDPEILAISFYTPIFFLLSKYAGVEEKEEEAVKILEKQVKEFYRIYKKK